MPGELPRLPQDPQDPQYPQRQDKHARNKNIYVEVAVCLTRLLLEDGKHNKYLSLCGY
jgi:hypothetical protein